MNNHPVRASELFAMLHGEVCQGPVECHWCGAPCERKYEHDDPPPPPFHRNNSTARRYHSQWICNGCYLWRRKSITVNFLGGSFKDRQCAVDHSWFITEQNMWALRDKEDWEILWKILIQPPKRFVLSIRGPKKDRNWLHLCECNDLDGILADTPLKWTWDNVPMSWTIYELTEAIKTGDTQGVEPGVRLLIEAVGKSPDGLLEPEKMMEAKKGRGRPSNQTVGLSDKTPRKVIVASGTTN